MITIGTARNRLMDAVQRTPVVERSLVDAVGAFAAMDATAPCEHPLFDTSAVDGYAFEHGGDEWRVTASLAAGDVLERPLKPGEAVRIFTGAAVPVGADTVVMQEFVQRTGDTIRHSDDRLRPGGNVRRRGEQVRVGDVLLQRGERITAAHVGLMASVGVERVPVHIRPRVALVRTGGEFREAGASTVGRIFSSNEQLLEAALRAEGHAVHRPPFLVRDERAALREAFSLAIHQSDLVISTGGVSVGEHDLVADVLCELGVELLFHGVRQKPGKPMLAARHGSTMVLALPGNPRAVLVAWHAYVLPVLAAMQGARDPWPRSELLPLAAPLQWKGGRVDLRAGQVRSGQVHLLADEGSHMLLGMCSADVLVELPDSGGELNAGAPVKVHYLSR
ncbi:MAG: molybdopterin molybdotransferase MoeA [Flavobacteriales bacterium]